MADEIMQEVYERLSNSLDSIFEDLAERHNLESGDIEVFQQVELENCINKISKIAQEWFNQNKNM